MGSTTPTASLPSASSPSLTLTLAHPDERPKTWSLTHPMWGPALSHSEYLAREHFMTTLPLAKDGGLTHWILTDTNSSFSSETSQRPILSSCETLRKHAVAARYDPSSDRVILTEGISHGIGSVFTDPQYRGKGYAHRMMQELGKRLRTWQVTDKKDRPESPPPLTQENENEKEEQTNTTLFSVLYSDIGKSFYAKNGWKAFSSSHISFKPIKSSASSSSFTSSSSHFLPATTPFPPNLSPISYHALPPLCTLDTHHLLTQTLPTLARSNPSKTHVALLPDLDCLLWHLLREDFMTQHIFHRTPSVRGAIYNRPDKSGQRVWAVWTRSYYRGLESQSIEGNHMHILRFVMEGVEDLGDEESLSKLTGEQEEYLVDAFRAILAVAQREAAEWRVEDVQMWNPSPLVSRLIEKAGIEGGYEMVERDMDSIPSLMWYGADGIEGGSTEDVEWVANEKYGWC